MTEHQLQIAVVRYLHYALPVSATFFAVPNGGQRQRVTAMKLKGEGVRPGVADIIVVWEGRALGIELKTAKGRQSPQQKKWAEQFTLAGGVYTVCRSVDAVADFLITIGVPVRARLTRQSDGDLRNKAA